MKTDLSNTVCQITGDPAWLSGKVFESSSRRPRFEPHDILWVFRGSVLGQDTSEPQSGIGETHGKNNKVSSRRDMIEILLKEVYSINQTTD